MDLQIIKKVCEDKRIAIKSLATSVGMTEQNLHRCIRVNNIQAGYLEEIAKILGVRVGVFFGEVCEPSETFGGDGNIVVNNSKSVKMGDVSTGDNQLLQERVSMLERLLDEKERLIQVLLRKGNTNLSN